MKDFYTIDEVCRLFEMDKAQLKHYAEKYNLHWGFVRDIDDELYINNTEFVDDMSDDSWRPLEEEL